MSKLPTTPNATKLRLERVAKRVLGLSGQKVSMAEALLAEGYTLNVAKNPQEVTKGRAWHEIMDELLPQEDVGKLHKELMAARHPELQEHVFYGELTDQAITELVEGIPGCRIISIRHILSSNKAKKEKDDEDEPEDEEAPEPVVTMKIAYYSAPDNRTRKDALDMAYKLRGTYAAEKHSNLNVVIPLSELRKMRDAGEI